MEEVTARNEAEAWRETEDGWSFGLRIAPAGLEAIGLPGRAVENADVEPTPAEAPEPAAASDAPMPDDSDAGAAKGGVGPADDAVPDRPLFRPGTKQARLAELISTPEGAGIEALSQALGWQVHTTRAALTGLRKKGLPVEAAKGADGKTVYRLGRTEAGSDET